MIDDFLGSINLVKINQKPRILAWLEAREFTKSKHLVIRMVNNDDNCDIYYPSGVKIPADTLYIEDNFELEMPSNIFWCCAWII